jgi:tetratricopeptide (TPR) repeat protein
MITRESLLYLVMGLMLGLGIGVVSASVLNQRDAQRLESNVAQDLAPGQPSGTRVNPEGSQAAVTATVEQARKEPGNFDAQLKAALLYYQIQRFDPAIEFLLKANKLRPDDYQTIAGLGVVNLDAGHFEEAEKWYRAAIAKKSDDVAVLAGLCAATLELGKVKAAEDAIAKLEKIDPTSTDLPNFHEKLTSLKSGDKPK